MSSIIMFNQVCTTYKPSIAKITKYYHVVVARYSQPCATKYKPSITKYNYVYKVHIVKLCATMHKPSISRYYQLLARYSTYTLYRTEIK